jgi:hypothetical protein
MPAPVQKTMTPHPYQAEDLRLLMGYFEVSQQAAALYCTGSGKTALALLLAAGTMGAAWTTGCPRFTHVIVAAPTKVIRDAFEPFHVKGHLGASYDTPVVIDEDLLPEGLASYLAHEAPNRVVRMTHDKLRNFKAELERLLVQQPQFARLKLLALDEAHHAGERQLLAHIRELWLKAGGSILHLTATPDRSDKTTAIPADVLANYTVRRSMTDQMTGGFAPEKLLSDIIRVAGGSRSDKNTVFEPVDPEAIAKSLVAHLEADDWPKAIGRLKGASDFAKHRDVIEAIAKALDERGKNVFIASDVHGAANPEMSVLNQKTLKAIRARTGTVGDGDLTEVLRYENSISDVRDSCVDFILGMHTVLEGMNWPLCSHIYFVGVPCSLLSLIQGVGRTMRNRRHLTADSEWGWRMWSKVVLLAAGEDDDEMRRAHSMQMLSIACYLATFRQWSVVGAIQDVFESIPYATPQEKERLRRQVKKELDISEVKAALIHQANTQMMGVFSARVEQKLAVTIGQHAKMTMVYIDRVLVPLAHGTDLDLLRSVTAQEIMQILIVSRPDTREEYRRGVKSRVEAGASVTEAVRETIEALVQTFEQKEYVASEASAVINTVLQQLSLDAEKMINCDLVLSSMLDDDGNEDDAPSKPKTRVHVPNIITQAIEGLR